MKNHTTNHENTVNINVGTHAFLASHYLKTLNVYIGLYETHNDIIESDHYLNSSLLKLESLLEDAASGDWESMKQFEKNGALTLLNALDIIEHICKSAHDTQIIYLFHELEEDLNYLYRNYFQS